MKTKYTKEQLATIITGRERGAELTKEEEQIAKDSGLFVIFGYSDDNMEIRGVQRDEFGCYDGGEFDIGPKGVVWIDEDDVDVLEKYNVLETVRAGTHTLEAKYGTSAAAWVYKTDIPHATFDIYEGDEDDQDLFCIGIIIDVEDIRATQPPTSEGGL